MNDESGHDSETNNVVLTSGDQPNSTNIDDYKLIFVVQEPRPIKGSLSAGIDNLGETNGSFQVNDWKVLYVSKNITYMYTANCLYLVGDNNKCFH